MGENNGTRARWNIGGSFEADNGIFPYELFHSRPPHVRMYVYRAGLIVQSIKIPYYHPPYLYSFT